MRRFNKLDWSALGELSEEELSFDINKEAELNDARKNPSFISDSSTTTSESSPLLEDFGVTQGPLGHEESNYDKETLVLNVASLKQISECKTSKGTGKKIQSSCETNREKGRSPCVNNWKDMKRKAAVNSGQQYVSRNGKVRNKRELGPVCQKTCKLKCFEKFDLTTRQAIHSSFWNLADHSKQWMFINKFTKKFPKRRMTTEHSSRRQFTIQYFLPMSIDNQLNSHDRVRVCLKTFLNTLSITDRLVRTAHYKLSSDGVALTDNRGKHLNHLIKIDSVMIKSVIDHVNSFQPIEIHDMGNSISKIYLDNNLSLKKMFCLYKSWDQISNYNNPAQTLRQYRDIVNKNTKVAFLNRKKDICFKCHNFSKEQTPTAKQVSVHNKHTKKVIMARELKNSDKTSALHSPETVCATFDFQLILNCPHGDVGLYYYKRRLSVFNCIVYDIGGKQGTCYMWPEYTGKRGTNEVSSCLMHFVKAKVDEGARNFLFWSNNCIGHYDNRIVYCLYMYLAKTLKVNITHRFLKPGHTQNESDSVRAHIERESRGKLIYTPEQWYDLVRSAKTNGKPYSVVEVTQQDFFDFTNLLDDKRWTKDTNKEDIKWNNVEEVSITKHDPDCLQIKYDLKDESFCLNTKEETNCAENKKERIPLEKLYTNTLVMEEAKYKDLVSLCDTGAIPEEYSRFYKNLKYCTGVSKGSDDSD